MNIGWRLGRLVSMYIFVYQEVEIPRMMVILRQNTPHRRTCLFSSARFDESAIAQVFEGLDLPRSTSPMKRCFIRAPH